MNNNKRFNKEYPILTGLALIGIAMLFRLLDIFIFRLDELWGEIILSKTLGFLLVLIYLRMTGESLKDISFNFSNSKSIIALGVVFTAVILCGGYVLEMVIFRSQNPELVIAGIDPKAGVSGGIGFIIFLLVGNVMNCFMEEGLFRGVLISLFLNRMSIKKVIILQGILFGLWHIPWAFKWYLTGNVVGLSGFLGALAMNSLPMILMGIVWGVMHYYSRSIWTPWISHFIVNSSLNLIHIKVDEALDSMVFIRMAFFLITTFCLVPLIIYISEKYSPRQQVN